MSRAKCSHPRRRRRGVRLVVVEFAYAVSTRGREVEVPCVLVVRVRDGVIVQSRDYADHVAMARAVGRLDVLAAALLAESYGP